MAELKAIPQPPKHLWGLMGNIPDMQGNPILSDTLIKLSKIYGDIYRLDIPTKRTSIIVGSHKIANELYDEVRFEKFIAGAQLELRPFLKDGLFTSFPDEWNWHLAHKLLMPVFGPIPIRKMFPKMLDISSQMILKWDRLGPDNEIDVSDDTTRLAFDTIGFCAFSYRFNEFYTPNVHPFATWMADALTEAGKRANRTALETNARVWSQQKYYQDIKHCHDLCDEIVADRKAHPQPDNNDLLNTMLTQKDSESGQGLSDENIRYQMGTFLVSGMEILLESFFQTCYIKSADVEQLAGHETTSGTLSFCLYEMLKKPECLHRAQQEVDDILGNDTLNLSHISKLVYVDACLKETLRLNAPITLTSVHAKEKTTIAGQYEVTPEQQLLINVRGMHRDPEVWGADAEEFKPERMLPENFAKLPPNAWKPFGNGMRGCIGRAFAWQEMMMVVSLILQRFTLEMADPSYDLKIKVTLTIKPANFHIKVRRRPGKGDYVGLFGAGKTAPTHEEHHEAEKANGSKLSKLTVCYGSNAGTCKALAEDLQSNGTENGFEVDLRTMDSATEHLPTDHPVVVITPSYEGQPPDNGKVFVSWLESKKAESSLLKGVKFSVFGVGNSDWANTYHRQPKLVRQLLDDMGGEEFLEAGFTDVKEDMAGDWETYSTGLWESLRSASGNTTKVEKKSLTVKISPPKHSKALGGQDIRTGVVRKSEELVGTEVGLAKRHMELEMPEDMEYEAGDYLVVLPLNKTDKIMRVVHRFDLIADDLMQVSDTSKSYLPIDEPQSIFDFFATSVELDTPITKHQLKTLAEATSDEKDRRSIESLAEDPTYRDAILSKRMSVLDVLEDHPTCPLSLAAYIDMLKPLTPRQYSISSSPLALHNAAGHPNVVSITYDVYDGPALSGNGRRFQGVASTYLASKPVGSTIRCMIRRTNIGFHLPADPTVPIIMIAAGTGLAPMHGFLQERHALHEIAGKELGPAILYFGCRDEEKDFIYKDELYGWQDKGIVEIRPTFSRAPVKKDAEKELHKYVADRIWAEREEMREMFKKGAKIFLCGSAAKVGQSTKDVCVRIYREGTGRSEEEGLEWLTSVSEERFVSDLFG